MTTVSIQTCRLGQTGLNDLDEGKMGKRFVSFIAVPDEASEANARRVLRHPHRQTALAHAGSASEHDQRALAAQRSINRLANRVTFSFSPDECGSFGE